LGKAAGLLIYLVAISIAIDVGGRLAGQSVRWPFEVYPWVAYWSALIGAGYVTYMNGNVRMDLLVEEGWLGPFQKVQPLFADIVSLIYLGTMIVAGAMLTSDLMASGRVTYELRTPLFYHALALPIGFGLAAAAVLWQMISRRMKPSDA
jgi:TRAP-type C4-dicarboxylate transport system permease small subunit